VLQLSFPALCIASCLLASCFRLRQPLGDGVDFFRWEIAPWASLAALCFTLSFDLEPMLASPFLASADAFVSMRHFSCTALSEFDS
jgi:hypothetical protein